MPPDDAHTMQQIVIEKNAEIKRLKVMVQTAYQYDVEGVDRWMFEAENKRLREEVKRERCFKESYLQSMNELLEKRK